MHILRSRDLVARSKAEALTNVVLANHYYLR